jgi:hypothetical protein
MKLHWKEGFFNPKYTLFEGDREVGFLKQSIFSSEATGKLFNQQYLFKRRKAFSSFIDIFEEESSQKIGEIKLDSLKTQARLTIDNDTYDWKYNNIWQTKWYVKQNETSLISYKSSFMKGEINVNHKSEAIILAGLYSYGYYVRLFVLLMMIVIIISSN